MDYSRINWKEAPNTSTPINAANLNHMDEGIEATVNEVNYLQEDWLRTSVVIQELIADFEPLVSNLLPYPYDQALTGGKFSLNNVDFTPQADGTVHITTNGKAASAATNFNLQYRNSPVTALNLKAGYKYALSGGTNECRIWINSPDNVLLMRDQGNGVIYTADKDYNMCSALIQVSAGANVDVTIRPMLTHNSVKGYREYLQSIEGIVQRFNDLFPAGAKALKATTFTKLVNVPANGASAAFEFTMPAGATVRVVNIKESWPQNSWANGAVANIVRWEQVGTTLKVSFTTTQAQTYNVILSVLYE